MVANGLPEVRPPFCMFWHHQPNIWGPYYQGVSDESGEVQRDSLKLIAKSELERISGIGYLRSSLIWGAYTNLVGPYI